jgi:hypothetical protein
MIYVCIRAQDDAATVGLLLWKVRQVFVETPREYRLLVANDGSTDDTAAVLKRYESSLPLKVFSHDDRRGFAASMDELFRFALKATDRPRRDCVITIDADYSVSPGFLPEFVRRFESGADVIIGEAPDVTRGSLTRLVRRAARHLLKPGLNLPGVDDLLSGVCAIRLMTLKRILPGRNGTFLLTDGEAGAAELIARAAGEARQIAVVQIPRASIRPGTRRSAGALSLALSLYRAGRALDIPTPETAVQRAS